MHLSLHGEQRQHDDLELPVRLPRPDALPGKKRPDLLCSRSNARKDTRILAHEDKPVEHVSSSEEIDFTREEAEGAKEDAEQGSECMHIIFSGNGIYKRTTYDSSPSLMFAWPKIVLDYR